ncbi:alpha/beta fold hydrolase [Variovorax ginsengisoli]|uniref:Pimeloyl-ACP methyl ester carboxylesterase n=1 Tax=Variovorax ginsengisoli TaxID=363844 RepID=A0ABT9SFW5_9BURK|nr:alpha/beta hydrolase [Variovorax ginsengisoli]MDP9902257.1 pimeloyl-ACP methyl ester carboxylesterase [Variovorax ginsengisoli]
MSAAAKPGRSHGAACPDGAGPTWVLLRGLTRERGHWGALPALLQQGLDLGCGGAHGRIVAIDLPGNGTLHTLRSPTQIGTTMQACRAQLEAAGLQPPFHVLAMSMGAMVTVEWAAQHPAELAACVLINTSMRPFSPWHQRLRPANYGALLRLALWPQPAHQREQAVLALTTRHAPDAQAVLQAWTQIRQVHPVSAMNALRQLLAAARYRAPPTPPRVPFLVLASLQDGLVDVACSRRLARHWQAPIREHASAGHDLPLDDGRWVVAQVRDWVRGLSQGVPERAGGQDIGGVGGPAKVGGGRGD